MSSGIREQYEALTPEQRLRVEEFFVHEMRDGWVPKETDIAAAIALVIRPRRPADDAIGLDHGTSA